MPMKLRRPPAMKPKVLVVDDDRAITQQLYWTLCEEYDVITANDMQTAIRRATFYKPDVSILDLQMPPQKDSAAVGMPLFEYIKSHLPGARLLIMSFKNRAEGQDGCFAARADEIFEKTFVIENKPAA